VSPQLHWIEAGKGDRRVLQGFDCATDPPRTRSGRELPHPAKWHRQVHAFIHALKMSIGDGILLLGEDDERRVAAVAVLYDSARDGEVYTMKLAALGVRLDCQGRGYGVEAIEVALEEAEARTFGGYSVLVVFGQVHVKNRPSQPACARAGLIRQSEARPGEEFEDWGTAIELSPDALSN